MSAAAVTGIGVHVPGLDAGPWLGRAPQGPACDAASAARVLGKRGLLAKDAATRLALCAVHDALGIPHGAPRPTGSPDPATAVVASSDLGNIETVVRVARDARRDGVRGVSPLEAPNASSNVVASSVALWFRFGGPNLMLCSGPQSGFATVRFALLLLEAQRARRVVVVVVEPDDDVARALFATGCAAAAPLRAAAACVILETPGHADDEVRVETLPRGASPDGSAREVDGEASRFLSDVGDAHPAASLLRLAAAASAVRRGPSGTRFDLGSGDGATLLSLVRRNARRRETG